MRSNERKTIWGDGSMVNTDHFYSKTMGFAVVDDTGEVLYKCGMHDPMACSYKAEMCALRAAIKLRGPFIHYVTDCKTLRDTFRVICDAGAVPLNVSFAHWWEEIFQATGFGNQCLLTMQWIRAHQFDQSLVGIDTCHLHNLFADRAARAAAIEACPVAHQTVKAWKRILINHQAWLCRLMKLISAQKDLDCAANGPPVVASDEGDSSASLEQQLRNKFSAWEWDTPLQQFDWQCDLCQIPGRPSAWNFSDEM
eukprot:Skav200959  [mRNA]  locus=scaffold448:329179:329937:- [translate_table: standard]